MSVILLTLIIQINKKISSKKMIYSHISKNKLIKQKRRSSQQLCIASSITSKLNDYLEESSDIIQVNEDTVPNIRFTILDDLEQLNQNINGKNSFQYSSCDLHQEDQNQKILMNQSGNFHSRSQNTDYVSQLSDSKKRMNTQGNFNGNKQNEIESRHQMKQQPFSNSRKAKVSSSNKYLKPKNGASPMSPLSPVSPINARNSNARNDKKPGHQKNVSSPIPKTMGLTSNTRINPNLRPNQKSQDNSNTKQYLSHKSLFDQHENCENVAKKVTQNCLKISENLNGSFMRPRMVCYTKTINLDDQVDLSVFNTEKISSNSAKFILNNKKDTDLDKKQQNCLFSKHIQSQRNKNKKTPKQPQKK